MPGLLTIMAINMIDICATFLLKLQATFIGYGHLWNLQMNNNPEQGVFAPNILSSDASNHGRIAELKAIQCYQSAHLTAVFGPFHHPADISLVKSKSGKASP